MNKVIQKQKVLEIVSRFRYGVSTPHVKLLALNKKVSCADRYLRWLQAEGYVIGERIECQLVKKWYRTGKK